MDTVCSWKQYLHNTILCVEWGEGEKIGRDFSDSVKGVLCSDLFQEGFSVPLILDVQSSPQDTCASFAFAQEKGQCTMASSY